MVTCRTAVRTRDRGTSSKGSTSGDDKGDTSANKRKRSEEAEDGEEEGGDFDQDEDDDDLEPSDDEDEDDGDTSWMKDYLEFDKSQPPLDLVKEISCNLSKAQKVTVPRLVSSWMVTHCAVPGCSLCIALLLLY